MSVFNKRLAVLLPLLLVAVLGLAACGGGAKQPVEVKVNLTEFKIEPSTTTFKVGTPYHFVVTNSGTVPHEMDIATFDPTATAVAETSGESQETPPLTSIEQDQLGAGATATVDYTFTKAGTYELACHLPGHYEGGMHVQITVTP